MRNLRDQSQIISRHLQTLREQFYSSPNHWLEVDRLGTMGASGLAEGTLNSNKVTKSFLMLEDGLRRVPDIQFQGNNLGFVPKTTGLSGKNVTAQEAKTIAQQFLGPRFKNATIKYERMIYGGFTSYMFLVSDPNHKDQEMHLSISVKGGHVAWMLGNRSARSSKLNLEECAIKAKSFLERNKYPNMEPVCREGFANIATITLASWRNRVLHYPELIKVQVAQDNGEVLGVDAVPFLTFNNPNEPTYARPRLSEHEIRKLLNPNLRPTKIRLAQVLDEMYNKVLCYEVVGMQNKDHFLVYYNANTGKEEKIRRVDPNGNEIR